MTFLHRCTPFARLLIVSSAMLFIFAAALGTAPAQTPTAGQNVNMVSGTSWPGGDPFLQRQNEPSMAVSSRNPLHLLAGANDYRTVDLPVSDIVPGSLAGDAWLGVFKSYDGGLTWQSYLLPGYPQDNSPAGVAAQGVLRRGGPDRPRRNGRPLLLQRHRVQSRHQQRRRLRLDASSTRTRRKTAARPAGRTRSSTRARGRRHRHLRPVPRQDLDRDGHSARGRRDLHVHRVRPVADRPGRQRLHRLEPVHRQPEHQDHVLALARLREDLVEPDQALRVELDQPGHEHRDRPDQRQDLRRLAAVRDLEQPRLDPRRAFRRLRRDVPVEEHDARSRRSPPFDQATTGTRFRTNALPSVAVSVDAERQQPRSRRLGAAHGARPGRADRDVHVVERREDLEHSGRDRRVRRIGRAAATSSCRRSPSRPGG